MAHGVTLVYYTANTEPPAFEAAIRRELAARVPEGMPVVSVSQDPTPLGVNLCVGRQHCCDANAFRQLLIGATLAETPWILVAEADCLYPPDYFRWSPPTADGVFRYGNVWILGGRGGYRRKEWTEGAQLVGRDTLIRALETALAGRPEWSGPDDPKPPELFKKRTWQTWGQNARPMISCKTGYGLRAFTGTIRGEEPVDDLPYWGDARTLRQRLHFTKAAV